MLQLTLINDKRDKVFYCFIIWPDLTKLLVR